MTTKTCLGVIIAVCIVFTVSEGEASTLLANSDFNGGIILHLGCGDGTSTKELGVGDTDLVHGLDRDPENVHRARQTIVSSGKYGRISVDLLAGSHLPYVDNMFNLVLAEDMSGISLSEIMRVLAPNGVALVKRDDDYERHVKPWPDDIDEWSHYMHDSTGNAVAHDTVIGPPRRIQWIGSPRYSRHHDRMSSMTAAVSSAGRVFYIFDESPSASILTSPQWTLIARDAFNGTILWKRRIDKWHDHLWPLKSGPAQLPRRLVSGKDRVYATLNIDGAVLYCSFDDKSAADDSGNDNDGSIESGRTRGGKIGGGIRFSGMAQPQAKYSVNQHWNNRVPLVAGDNGAILYVVSASTGDRLDRQNLYSPPVFDGMIAAQNRLYISTVDGNVTCFK